MTLNDLIDLRSLAETNGSIVKHCQHLPIQPSIHMHTMPNPQHLFRQPHYIASHLSAHLPSAQLLRHTSKQRGSHERQPSSEQASRRASKQASGVHPANLSVSLSFFQSNIPRHSIFLCHLSPVSLFLINHTPRHPDLQPSASPDVIGRS
ncbi:hypothetical protein BKA80DRAFT_34615 [Phyllosticta citrichinensis]